MLILTLIQIVAMMKNKIDLYYYYLYTNNIECQKK